MMKILNLLAFVCLVYASLTFARAQSLPRLNRNDDARPRELLSEGLGVGRIYVGHSTMDDVVAVYGKTFETVDHGTYSYEMRYASLGLSFWYCRADEQKRIFEINAVAPFNGFTARGILLGKSTLRDVFAIYGNVDPTTSSEKVYWSFEYPGVEFIIPYKELGGKPVSSLLGSKVTAIDIVTSRGSSYCNDFK